MENLPTGVVKAGGRNKGYRVLKYINGRTFQIGSFQNVEHAILVNDNTNRMVKFFREELAKATGTETVSDSSTVDDIKSLIVENSISDVLEITRLVNELDALNEYRIGLLNENIARMQEHLSELDQGMRVVEPVKQSVWKRFTVRPKQ